MTTVEFVHTWVSVLADNSVIARTVVGGGEVVGNIVSFLDDGERAVGYWIGRQFWGRGHATRALAEYLREVSDRPLHATVAEHNGGSARVLAKCGFVIVGQERNESDHVKEIRFRLHA